MTRRGGRRVVPRFRRSNLNEIDVDADENRAQQLINEDLKSSYQWSADLQENSNSNETNSLFFVNDQSSSSSFQLDQFICEDQYSNQFDLSTIDSSSSNSNPIDLCSLPINQWISSFISTEENCSTLKSSDDEILHRWNLDENDEKGIVQLSLMDSEENSQLDLTKDDSSIDSTKIFLQGDSFLHQMEYSISSLNEDIVHPSNEDEDEKIICYDGNVVEMKHHLNVECNENEKESEDRFVQGEMKPIFSLNFTDEIKVNYSPLIESLERTFDPQSFQSLQWSIRILKDDLSYRFCLSFPDEYSPPHYSSDDDPINRKPISLEERNDWKEICYSFNEIYSDSFQLNLLSMNDLKEDILSFIDEIEMKRNFGVEDSFHLWNSSQWNILQQMKDILYQISPEEYFQMIYSPSDAHPIDYQRIFLSQEEFNQKTFRKYRCKHFSIKSEINDQLDLQQLSNINEQQNLFPHDEQSLLLLPFHDLQIDQSTQDPIESYERIFNDFPSISFDLFEEKNFRSMKNIHGVYLTRDDYQCEPPKCSKSSRKEIGWISFNAAELNPIYHLNKSNKRYLHLPQELHHLSIPIYHGYQEFIEKIRSNPLNYYLPFDNLDLRPLLYWYTKKQYLFSSTDSKYLKPPDFLCRRLVLRKILSNLYCDSEPWKIYVLRFKGQFYLSLANLQCHSPDQLTEDEYAGYHFESLLTTEQPNTTRIKEEFPLKDPLKQFHTVQYWNFGKYSLLYSNEIDAQIHPSHIPSFTQEEKCSNENPSDELTKAIEEILSENETLIVEDDLKENSPSTVDEEEKEKEIRSGYVELKCTKKKIFYRDENKLQTLSWWAQMYLANIEHLVVGYKTSDGLIDQIQILSIRQLISKFFSAFHLRLKYCLSYLYAFLELIEKTVTIDDLHTIHAFAYIPQPLEIHSQRDEQMDDGLPSFVPFRYTQIPRQNSRYQTFLPDFYLEYLQKSSSMDLSSPMKSIDQEKKKRYSHRGRKSCPLKH